jgi:hypothetical protein
MYDITRSSTYLTKVTTFINYILALPKTPKGLVWTSASAWGSNRYAANLAMYTLQVT